MRIYEYEDDREVQIPNWYMKLSQNTLNRLSSIGIMLNQLMFRKKKTDRSNAKNIKFDI